jgi:hypothetical protein
MTKSKEQKGFESRELSRFDFQVEPDKNVVFNT